MDEPMGATLYRAPKLKQERALETRDGKAASEDSKGLLRPPAFARQLLRQERAAQELGVQANLGANNRCIEAGFQKGCP
jgi:hypothetical protein